MIYIFLNGYLPTISTRLGARSSHNLRHRSDGYPTESHIPQGLKKPQNILLSLFHTHMALPRALPSSPLCGRRGGGGRPLCGASSSSAWSSNLHINVTCTHHIHARVSTMCIKPSTSIIIR